MSQQKNRNEGESAVDRRRFLASIMAVGAVAAASTSTAQSGDDETVGIGGGPMSDELAHRAAQVYSGPGDDVPDAGREGRYYHVTGAGGGWSAGDLLEDDGSSWSKIDLGAGSVSTDDLNIGGHKTVAATTGDIVTSEGERFDPNDYSDFGAAANAAIQSIAAPDHANDSNAKGAVYLPAGESEPFSTPILMDRNRISLLGAGRFGTILNHTGDRCIHIKGASRFNLGNFSIYGDMSAGQDGIFIDTSGSDPVTHFRVSNMRLHYNGRHHITYSVSHDGYDNNRATWFSQFDNLLFSRCGDHAYYRHSDPGQDGTATVVFQNIRSAFGDIEGNMFYDRGVGHERKYINCHADPNVQGRGYYLVGDAHHLMLGCKAETWGSVGSATSDQEGFYIRDVIASSFTNLWAHGNSPYGFFAYGGYSNCFFHNISGNQNDQEAVRFGGNGTNENNLVGIMPKGYNTPGSGHGITDLMDGGVGPSENLAAREGNLNEIANHDGSDSGSTQADLYRWDNSSTVWVRVGDETTTIDPNA